MACIELGVESRWPEDCYSISQRKEERKMREKGFTLIELMIVVAIIAVIAAIAIPSLLGARIGSNEAVAMASLRAVAGAQNMYRRSDWDNDLVFEYTGAYSVLNTQTDASGKAIKLIDDALANAAKTGLGPAGKTLPKAGYVFIDLTGDFDGTTYVDASGDNTVGYGLCGVPEAYNRTGRNSFVINIQGTVYQKDIDKAPGVVLFPDTYTDKWATTGG